MALTLQTVTETQIASPPGTYFKLREAIEDPDATFEDYSRIISLDPALAARLLKVVNSPFYGLTARVETIAHALNIVGSDQLSELALATSVISQFDGLPPGLIDLNEFWAHSVACGVAARHIAQHCGMEEPDRYYVAGMLHDIGKLVLFREAPGQVQTILAQFDPREDLALVEMESKIMGFNHAQIGGILLKEWKLPANLADAVNAHHDPSKAKLNPKGAAVVHVADFLVYEMKLGSSGEPALPPLKKSALTELGLTLDFIKDARVVVFEEADQALQLFM